MRLRALLLPAFFVVPLAACGPLVGGDFDGWSSVTASSVGEDGGAPAANPDEPAPLPPSKVDAGASKADASSPIADASLDADGGGCPAGRIRCGTICIDPNTHDSHCGGCGKKCGTNEDCFGGQCKPQPPANTTALSQCYVTPQNCADICNSLGKICASTCGATGTATAIVYDKSDLDCSDQGFVRPDPSFCGYTFPASIYGSMQCCCGPK